MAEEFEWDPFADPADEANASRTATFEVVDEAIVAPGDVEVSIPYTAPAQVDELESLEAAEAAYAALLLEAMPPVCQPYSREEDVLANEAAEIVAASFAMAADPSNLEAGKPEGNELTGALPCEGPVYISGQITAEFCKDLLQWQKQQKTLAKEYAYRIVMDVIDLLQELDTVVDVSVSAGTEITVCGDIHGQYYDLLNIWEINGLPSEANPYLFNGDFVDRGSFSVEVILALFSWKLLYPQHLHLARGNHESKTMNSIYGFEGEVTTKYDAGLFMLFCDAFNLLPLCHIINNSVFVVHGGLFSEDGVTVDEIRRIDRNCEPPDEGLMVEMLWSDPYPGRGRAPSKRGVGISFGEDVTDHFLETNGLDLVIRSHEMCEEGYRIEHGGKLITLFSAPNYCDQMGNEGAFIRLDGATLTPVSRSFVAVPHPPVRAMQYATPLPYFGMSLGMVFT